MTEAEELTDAQLVAFKRWAIENYPDLLRCGWCETWYSSPGAPEPYPSTRMGCPECGADAGLFGEEIGGGE